MAGVAITDVFGVEEEPTLTSRARAKADQRRVELAAANLELLGPVCRRLQEVGQRGHRAVVEVGSGRPDAVQGPRLVGEEVRRPRMLPAALHCALRLRLKAARQEGEDCFTVGGANLRLYHLLIDTQTLEFRLVGALAQYLQERLEVRRV